MHKINVSFAYLVGKYSFFFLCVFHRRKKLMQVCSNMREKKNHHSIFIFVWAIPLNVVRNFEGSEKTQGCSLLASIYGHSLKMSCTVTNGSSSVRASIEILTIFILM